MHHSSIDRVYGQLLRLCVGRAVEGDRRLLAEVVSDLVLFRFESDNEWGVFVEEVK